MGIGVSTIAGRTLNMSNPINWAHPSNVGLVSEWAVVANSPRQWGGPTLRDLCFVRNAPSNGTLANGPTWQGAQGRPGGYGSMGFAAASSQYLNVANGATSLSFASSSKLTISAWVRRTSNSVDYETVLTKRSNTTGSSSPNGVNYELSFNNANTAGSKAFGFYSGSGFTISSTLVPLAIWTHVATVSNSGGTTYYVNGLPAGTSTDVVATNTADAPRIGGVGGSDVTQYLSSALDELCIFNADLSAKQMLSLYAEQRAGNPNRWNLLSTRTWFVPPHGHVWRNSDLSGLAGVGQGAFNPNLSGV